MRSIPHSFDTLWKLTNNVFKKTNKKPKNPYISSTALDQLDQISALLQIGGTSLKHMWMTLWNCSAHLTTPDIIYILLVLNGPYAAYYAWTGRMWIYQLKQKATPCYSTVVQGAFVYITADPSRRIDLLKQPKILITALFGGSVFQPTSSLKEIYNAP